MDRINYDIAPGLRRSDLWVINKSPAHFRYAIDHEEDPTPALRFGIAAHKFILEPETFPDEIAIAPQVDRRTKEGKETWANFLAKTEGMTQITADDFTQICDMSSALKKNQLATQLLTGEHEKEFFWTDTETGTLCKCKCDCVTTYDGKPYIVDYKTTDSCEPGAFERSCRKYGYKFQAGMYTEGVFANTLDEYGFAFVAQEKNAPYACRVYFCSEEFIAEGKDKFRELIGLYHECEQTGNWPGYDEDGAMFVTLFGEDEGDDR